MSEVRTIRSTRFAIPEFLRDLGREPGAVGILVTCSVALAAAGLDPHVFGPSTPNVQAALRARPELENLLLAVVVVKAALFLVGGALGDLVGRRWILVVGLAGLVLAEAASALFGAGLLFSVARLGAAASVGLIVPAALASVAVTYQGISRATAIGLAYAAYGAAQAVAPMMLTALSPSVGRWPSFLAASLAGLLALQVVRSRIPLGEAASGVSGSEVAGHALWAFGLLAITASVVGVGGGWDSPARILLVACGLGALSVFAISRRGGSAAAAHSLRLRPVTIALFAGVVIAFAQTAPLLQAPIFFQLVQQYGPLAATLATLPALLALVAAGPLAGALLGRFSPRVLIPGGLAAVGAGDLLMATATPGTGYVFFVLPFLAIGAGFVVGTTIRTAVIFASVPRRLPATAAALNETSILIGSQLGIIVVTALVAQVAVDTYSGSVAGLGPSQVTLAVDQFKAVLDAIGTSAFGQTIDDLGANTAAQYGAAYAAGVSASLAVVGVVALVSSVLAWLGLGEHERLETIWDYSDERSEVGSGSPASVSNSVPANFEGMGARYDGPVASQDVAMFDAIAGG